MILTWLEISKSALLNNVAQIKKHLPKKTKFIAVVKSNAYGHGILQVVSQIKSKEDAFAVYDFNDALLLCGQFITAFLVVWIPLTAVYFVLRKRKMLPLFALSGAISLVCLFSYLVFLTAWL